MVFSLCHNWYIFWRETYRIKLSIKAPRLQTKTRTSGTKMLLHSSQKTSKSLCGANTVDGGDAPGCLATKLEAVVVHGLVQYMNV